MVSLSPDIPHESDDEDPNESNTDAGGPPMLIVNNLPDGTPLTINTLKILAQHSLEPGR